MTGFLGKPSASGLRWVARVLGTIMALFLLAEFIEWVTGPRPPAVLRDYLVAVGWLLVILGFAFGWFKDLAASLLVLGGTALVCVIMLLPPGEAWPWKIFIVTAILGFLYLFVHFAGKKEKAGR